MNALNYEEAVHKLLKVQLKEGEEVRHCLVVPNLRAEVLILFVDRTVQDGHRVLFSRTFLLSLLWSHW